MELLSSLIIPQTLAAIGAALLVCLTLDRLRYGEFNKVCMLVAVWLIFDISIDYLATGLSEYWSAIDSVVYYYLFSITSLFFLYQVATKSAYPKSMKIMFTTISIVCVLMAFYRWGVQSRWSEGGANFYHSYGLLLDSAFVYSIVAMDALLILLGVYSALATSTNSNNSIRGERR